MRQQDSGTLIDVSVPDMHLRHTFDPWRPETQEDSSGTGRLTNCALLAFYVVQRGRGSGGGPADLLRAPGERLLRAGDAVQ